jgi:HEAT repeat protein
MPVRLGAMEAVLQMKDEKAVDAISEQLKHENERVRKYALRALRTIGDTSCKDQVRKVLAEDEDEYVRATAAITIADLVGEAAIPDLRARKEDLSAAVRLEAANALAGLGSDAVEALAAFLGDPDDSVRLMAVEGLGQIGDDSTVAAISSLAQDKSPRNKQIRIKVADALGRIGDRDAVPALVELANDREPAVRREAARALGRVGGDKADEALDKLMKDPIATVRAAARRAKNGGR